jgi:hypothetical protein
VLLILEFICSPCCGMTRQLFRIQMWFDFSYLIRFYTIRSALSNGKKQERPRPLDARERGDVGVSLQS